jgi:hypothetical protein
MSLIGLETETDDFLSEDARNYFDYFDTRLGARARVYVFPNQRSKRTCGDCPRFGLSARVVDRRGFLTEFKLGA